ncbi:hypothetical protein [Rheinheimera sp.]|uniref:hypothetical protein n=1 Tax=Rheinheimera sp. TaxID=1869214 RepID=UPI002FDEE37E
MQHRSFPTSPYWRRLTLVSVTALGLAACSSPPSGSEEYWFNKLQMEHRAQCSLLPEPLASSCLKDVANRSYQDFVRGRSAAINESQI